jgi:hypothetical protein
VGKLLSLKQDVPIQNTLVSSLTYSAVVDIGSSEGVFAMQVVWNGGIAPNINVSLEVSNNLQDWSAVAGSTVNITSVADNLMYDPMTSGAEFLRIKFAPVSGSAIFSAYFNGKAQRG